MTKLRIPAPTALQTASDRYHRGAERGAAPAAEGSTEWRRNTRRELRDIAFTNSEKGTAHLHAARCRRDERRSIGHAGILPVQRAAVHPTGYRRPSVDDGGPNQRLRSAKPGCVLLDTQRDSDSDGFDSDQRSSTDGRGSRLGARRACNG